ncbi:MAG: phosphoribosylformylglycinamidine synthase subunit PurQ [Planctomycetota bacterium]|nr:MAG: phosphoribosylformylglycinamidine synthase subunit PurQ [Planctomycetota bacterium]
MKPRVLLLRAAGVNCDRELAYAFERAGATVEQRHIRELAARPAAVAECDLFAIPGGFTYGDDLGAGRILAVEVERFLGEVLAEHHARGGSVFGVCNGFQTLVKARLLPDLADVRATLTWNASGRFECRWTRLRVEGGLARLLPEGFVLPAPVAHAEGRLVLADAARDLQRLEAGKRIALRYVDARGRPTTDYPDCPSGSSGGIAGLVSASGRILGLMPHPERNLSAAHTPDGGAGAWGRGGEGITFYRALLSPYRSGAVV